MSVRIQALEDGRTHRRQQAPATTESAAIQVCPHCAGHGYYFADSDEYVCVCAAGEAYADAMEATDGT